MMKAAIIEKYGSPEVFQIKQVKKPEPRKNEVLIKIHSSAVNSGDWRIRKADPPIVRLFFGLFRPRKKILGYVFSGEIAETGSQVTRFRTGDQVFGTTGMRFGAYAENVCLPEKGDFIIRPAEISHEEAACLPFGGTTALHFLRKGKIKEGHRILVYGASGATGTAAVQLAKHFGADVTGVCSPANTGLVKQLGASEVFNYQQDEYTRIEQQFDIVFDAVGKTTFKKCKHLIRTGGKYVTVNKGLARSNRDDFEFLAELTANGKYKAVIDKQFPLVEIAEAHRYAESFRKKGNVVIRVA